MSEVWVIRDFEKNYITANRCFLLVDEEWLYLSYTGKAMGFSCYSNKLTAKKDFEYLKEINNKHNFEKRFYLEYIDIKKIPSGARKIEKIKKSESLLFCAK